MPFERDAHGKRRAANESTAHPWDGAGRSSRLTSGKRSGASSRGGGKLPRCPRMTPSFY